MKSSVLIGISLLLASFASAQSESPITFEAYPVHLQVAVDEVDKLEAPSVSTSCELDEGQLTVRYEDKNFSGGKHGTIERTWIATDACGNEARSSQFISPKDRSALEKL